MNYPICLYQIETTNGLQWMAEFPDIQDVQELVLLQKKLLTLLGRILNFILKA